MKIGQKVVCVKSRPSLVCTLTVGQIYTFDGYDPLHRGFVFLKEVTGIIPHPSDYAGEREAYPESYIRPVDETFGEETAERLEKEFISQPEPAFV